MATDHPEPPGDDRVIDIRSRQSTRSAKVPVEDLSKYEHEDNSDDYRHRMIVNVAAFLFIAALIGAGVWLADSMASMRKNQDCVLSGRRGCSPVDVDGR